jgi:hypothetical protein
MLENIAWTVALIVVTLYGSVMVKAAKGDRWSTNIRGLLFAAGLIAFAIYMIIRNLRN